MKLLKHATLILCMTVSGCSMFGGDKISKVEPVPAEPKVDLAWLDDYEPRLRDALKDSRFELERRDALLVVTAPVDGSFNPDRPGMLLPATLGPLSRVAKMVENDSKTAVVVLGHADSTGAEEANRVLSRERAGAVAAIFRLSGLKTDRLLIRGLGSDMPRAANDSSEGRALNRRVEMVLAPQSTMQALVAQYSQPAAASSAAASTQVAVTEVVAK
ncbi:OmpA family protein [Stutzerimonas nosocomialis]|uniref:OmpA family protein n=1 Tax=Stutzerimonas nosocomialis TaxID=1056496 RepID=A0A5R9QEV3_9GAMM|nr:OmpA family protein [Stutzerimonas nosocomialis]TLX63510.1 OmpA family protein [Stutzerimonas nosocomialis]